MRLHDSPLNLSDMLTNEERYRFGDYVLDAAAERLTFRDMPVPTFGTCEKLPGSAHEN